MLHHQHRNPTTPAGFTNEMLINDSVVHEFDAIRFFTGEEITSVQVRLGKATKNAPAGQHDPQHVLIETESGVLADVEIYVNAKFGYEVATQASFEDGIVSIGGDKGPYTRSAGRWGGNVTPGFEERFGAAYDVEIQSWVDAALARRNRRPHRLGRVRHRRLLRSRRRGAEERRKGRREAATPSPPTSRTYEASSFRSPATLNLIHNGVFHVKIALDPTPFHHSHSLLEFPRVVADLGYKYMQMTPHAGLHPVLQPPQGRRRTGGPAEARPAGTPGSRSPPCCRCSAGPGRTRTPAKRRSGTGSAPSRSPWTWASAP